MYAATIIDTVLDKKILDDDVLNDIRWVWEVHELGNDDCYISWDEEMSEDCPNLAAFIEKNFGNNFGGVMTSPILIHHWW